MGPDINCSWLYWMGCLKMVFLEILENANYAGFCSASHICYCSYGSGMVSNLMNQVPDKSLPTVVNHTAKKLGFMLKS